MSKGCMARCYGSQMICGACQVTWDIDDVAPECDNVGKRAVTKLAKFDAAQGPLIPAVAKILPERLPDDIALEMLRTFNANGGHILGLQMAYRLLLDRIEP